MVTNTARRLRLFRLDAACPRCGAHPAVRAFSALMAAVRELDAGEDVMAVQCQARGCPEQYIVEARAFHGALLVVSRTGARN